MGRIRILQVGDVHFPVGTDGYDADMYDAGLTRADAMAPRRLETVAASLVDTLQSSTCPVTIAICGDLTTRGDKENYREAAFWLHQLLDLPTHPPEQLMVVPGNHDVHRPDVQSPEDDLFLKFDYLKDTWESIGSPGVMAPDTVRLNDIQLSDGRIYLASLNSCLMCGSYRILAAELQEAIVSNYLELNNNSSPKDAEVERITAACAITKEQVDVPGIHERHIQELHDALEQAPVGAVAIILAHHNVLPQFRPRIAPYPELINAGRLRATLVRARVPTIYLHGHVHNDPIEALHDHTGDLLDAAFIGAPELRDGFNQVDVVMTTSGTLLGIDVTAIRVRDGTVRRSEAQSFRIPMVRLPPVRRQLVRQFVRLFGEEGELRFEDVLVKVYSKNFEFKREEAVKELLLEAWWLGEVHLTLDNQLGSDPPENQDPTEWTVRVI
jgi:3',5'-cyclic AMP phosphodiesterase CpdA